MAIRRGFQAVADLKKEYDAREEIRAAGYTPIFGVKDGETVEDVWFNGTDNEPVIYKVHDVKLPGNQFRSVRHRDGQCVPCFLRKQGAKNIGAEKDKGVFLVADPRMMHKVRSEKYSTKDREKFDYIKCPGEDECPHCAKGIEPEPAGQKKFELSMKWVFSLMTKNALLGEKCMCGGKIKTVQKPNGNVSHLCSKCGTPSPLNMFKVPFSIDRTGTSTSTAYGFAPGRYEEMPSWVEDLNPPDLDVLYQDPTIEQQCRELDCENPFKQFSSKSDQASESYEDEQGGKLFE
jgi:hypothetical protein